MNWAIQRYWYTLIDIKITIYGGERGIRTNIKGKVVYYQ